MAVGSGGAALSFDWSASVAAAAGGALEAALRAVVGGGGAAADDAGGVVRFALCALDAAGRTAAEAAEAEGRVPDASGGDAAAGTEVGAATASLRALLDGGADLAEKGFELKDAAGVPAAGVLRVSLTALATLKHIAATPPPPPDAAAAPAAAAPAAAPADPDAVIRVGLNLRVRGKTNARVVLRIVTKTVSAAEEAARRSGRRRRRRSWCRHASAG